MSKILDLAKSFEQTSSEQAKDTEQVVAKEFKKHEQRLIDLLTENEKAIVLELRVAQSDMGKVIGKQGRIAKAIRSVVKAAASKEDKKVIAEIVQ